MNTTQPIFTEKARCQDCYRCVRTCPVKAIKIEQAVASVVEEVCIHCGKCVSACPAGAKKVRDDTSLVEQLLGSGRTVIASIAPSFRAEFDGIDEREFVGCLRRMGFTHVSETALGAEEISGQVLMLMERPSVRGKAVISSACPVVVNCIRKYYPSLTHYITPLMSPLMAHCRQLKSAYPDAAVVFFGPCIAKKDELLQYPGLCDAVLTFENLKAMLSARNIVPRDDAMNGSFVPGAATEGLVYPVDGGMIAGIRRNTNVVDQQMMHFSGMTEVLSVLDSLVAEPVDETVFLELLACSGGCINGPVMNREKGILSRKRAVVKKAQKLVWNVPTAKLNNAGAVFLPQPLVRPEISPEALLPILRATGKHTATDEINCGGCGYGNCREFAAAVLDGRAETAMCVTYMRQLALKKANKLISAMPAGVVIVDATLKIIECNERFAALSGGETLAIYHTLPGMNGALLERVFPVAQLFRHVLDSGDDIVGKETAVNGRLFRCSIFTVEAGTIVGGIVSDITDPELKQEEIINRARSVIRNNLATVQKIAYLLGENASETEMVLSGIIDCFAPVKRD